MKKHTLFILRYLSVVIVTFVFLTIFTVSIILYPKNVFENSYQSVIQTKFDNLVEEMNPKIIIIGGSSAGFGINEQLLNRETGYPVVNLGLHAGFGCLFNTEIAKANIRKGDIVLLGYEYSSWYKEDGFDKLGVDLVMSGIDNKIEMYRCIPIKNWIEIIGYLPEYYKIKANYSSPEGTYSRESFNEKGQMTLTREFSLFDYNENREYYGYVNLDKVNISENSVNYLKKFKEYVESQGASIYFISPPLYEEAKVSDDQSFLDFVKQEEEKIGIQYISNPLDYIYSREYIFDTIYHCNNEGEIKRTEQLIDDLRKYKII